MEDCKKINTYYLYVFVFAAAFNDVLRIGDSVLTLYRMMVPLALVITIADMKVRKLYIIAFLVGIISFFQSSWFSLNNDLGIHFSTVRYLTYVLYYMLIVILIGAIIYLLQHDFLFFNRINLLLSIIGAFYLLLFLANYMFPNIREFIHLTNPNDYGACLAALTPFFIYYFKKKRIVFVFIMAELVLLVVNDTKFALLSVLIQLSLFFYLEIRNKISRGRNILMLFFLLIMIIILSMFSYGNISLNGYSWNETVLNPISKMIKGEMYSTSNTSAQYRANVFIMSVHYLMKTKLLGIGIGNAGVLARKALGSVGLYEHWLDKSSISLHNSILEILLEFGYLAVIGFLVILKRLFIIINKKNINNKDKCFFVTVVSALLWLQGPSGILMIYTIFIVMTVVILIEINANY